MVGLVGQESAKVQRKDDKWNFIDRQGKLLSDEQFSDAYYLTDWLQSKEPMANGAFLQKMV